MAIVIGSVEGGLMPDARKTKESVHYRQHEQCMTCDHFFPSGSCALVEGTISPKNVCDLWEIRSAHPMGRDREFYEAEYNKSRSE